MHSSDADGDVFAIIVRGRHIRGRSYSLVSIICGCRFHDFKLARHNEGASCSNGPRGLSVRPSVSLSVAREYLLN